MIWFNLILLVVSFIAMALLAPKPNIENARPQSFDDITFPQASENAPNPLILGKVRNEGPNTIWYGGFETVPIEERVKTGLFSKKNVVVGYNYYLSLDMALGLGEDISLHEIYIDEELVWSGNTAEAETTAINISRGDLFGGHKEGGGWASDGTFYSGTFTQPIDGPIETLVGGAGSIPAYRGSSHITFNRAWIGESVSLRKTSFVVSKYTNGLGLTGGKEKIGDDMNPAEAIFQIMTDTWLGLGISSGMLDTIVMTEVAQVLYDEGNGVSIRVAKENTARNVLTEILRQIDGIMYQDPETGLIILKLIREDYDVDTLLVYDEVDIVDVKSFSRTSWDEVRGQIKVTYKQRDKESTAVAVAQDSGVIATTGKLLTDSITFPFLYDKTVAQDIASRELSQASVPLFRVDIEFNRNAYKLRPGSVFKLSWDGYGIQEIVLRVQKFDFGKLTEGKMVATCLQDSFAVNATLFAVKEESGWTAPSASPTDILVWEVPEMHYFHTQRLQFPLDDGFGMVIPLPKQAQALSSSFDFAHAVQTGDVDDFGSLVYKDPQEVLYPATGVFSAGYGAMEGVSTGIDATGFVLLGVQGVFRAAANVAELRQGEFGLLYANGEWMGYTGLATNDTFTNIYRGLFGTTPKDHAISDRVYQFEASLLGEGYNDEMTDTATLFYKLLDRTGSIVQSTLDFTEQSVVLNAEANRPYRPRALQADAARTGLTYTPGGADAVLTWFASDRTEIDEITLEADAAEIPDQTEDYDVQVWINGVYVPALSTTNTTSPWSIPFSTALLTGYHDDPEAEIRVYSQRTVGDFRFSSNYALIRFHYDVDQLLLSGDAQSGTDKLLLSGDAQTSGTDVIELS